MRRSIGIDISDTMISIVQLCHARDELSIEHAHIYHLPSGTSPKAESTAQLASEIKTAITEGGFNTHTPVTIAMFYGRVFFSTFRTDITSEESVRRLLKFEVEDDFPIPFDDLIVDICGWRDVQEQNREFLVGAVSRSDLQNCVKIVREAGLRCTTVSADACALQAVTILSNELSDNTCFVSIFLDSYRTIIAISEADRLVCVRFLNDRNRSEDFAHTVEREIDLTWCAAFNTHIPPRTKILLSGANEIIHDLFQYFSEETNYEIGQLAPFTQISYSSPPKQNSKLVIALGLALIGINKQNTALDFYAVDKVRAEQTAKTKRSALVFGFLLLATSVLLVISLFIQLNRLEANHQRLDQQTREVFMQTLPQEKRIVNELAQMTEKLKVLRQECDILKAEMHSKAPCIRVLKHISERIPQSQNVSISRIFVTAESVRLSGVVPSFESVDVVVEILRQISEFDSVELQNVDMDPITNKVRFSLLIALAEK